MNSIHGKSLGKTLKRAENIDLQALFSFFIAATSRTFTEAADRLCLSQSAVSHAMSKLEKSLGAKLWEKIGHFMRLTDAGRELLRTCERVFNDLRDIQEKLANPKPRVLTGLFNIGTTVEFGNSILAENLHSFMKSHPDLELGLTFSHSLLAPLLSGDLDVIVDCWVHAREDLWRIPLFREQYILVASPDLLKINPIRKLQDLAKVTWLSLDREGLWWHRFLDQIPEGIELDPPRIMLINHLRGMVHLAVGGAGVALIPAYCGLTEIRSGKLVVLFPGRKMRQDRLSLYCKRIHRNSSKIKAFAAFMRSLKLAD